MEGSNKANGVGTAAVPNRELAGFGSTAIETGSDQQWGPTSSGASRLSFFLRRGEILAIDDFRRHV